MHPFRSILALLLIVAFGLAGCGRPLERADLVLINGAEVEVLDPPLATAQATGRVLNALFEGLTNQDPAAKITPGVAERWEISPDGLRYTFFLRANARWSNGDPVTAHDFAYSWQRTLSPATACEYAGQLYPVKNAREFNEGKLTDFSQVGVRVVNDLTLEVTLGSPTAYFLDLCAFVTLQPVHRATVEKHRDWSTNPAHMVCNGPFTLKEWRLFDRLRLEKNPHYWNAGIVKLQSIDVLPSAKPNTAFNFYSTGLADIMMDKGLAPVELLGELKHRPDFHSAPFLGNYFIRFNTTRKHFADPRVRLAFAMVVDKSLITEKISRAGELPAFSLTPPGAGTGYQPPAGVERNYEKARELLAAANYPGGKGFPIIYYLYKGDSDVDRNIAVELQGMFQRELGIRMELQAQEWTAYLNSQGRLDYDLCRSSWVADYNDPFTFLGMFITNDGNNRTGWSNAGYDRLMAASGREVDPAKRYEIFRQAEEILISKEAPILPLYYYVGVQFYDATKLGGVEPNVLDEHRLHHIYWKQPR